MGQASGDTKFRLKQLRAVPRLTRAFADFMAECGITCMEASGHKSGVRLKSTGTPADSYVVLWDTSEGDSRFPYSYAHPDEATEYGACGVAILLVLKMTGYRSVARSKKGTGIDWWLGQENAGDLPFQNSARLEVSGIRKGDAATVTARVKAKIEQSKQSDGSKLPGYIVVIEFGLPQARVVQR